MIGVGGTLTISVGVVVEVGRGVGPIVLGSSITGGVSSI